MFNPPPFADPLVAALYYGAVFILYDTAYTIVNAPYSALTSELTEDYDERSSLAGWRMANSIFASLLTAGLFKVLAENVFVNWFEGPNALVSGYAVARRFGIGGDDCAAVGGCLRARTTALS
ncbi:MAG: MFS transporter [Caldilineaceae bacterium]